MKEIGRERRKEAVEEEEEVENYHGSFNYRN
jgi:hypothetical protein